jgi:hypothetical protein
MKLGVTVAQLAVWELLRAAGIGQPGPRRRDSGGRQFLPAQADGMLATGFLHVGTVLLKRMYVLVFTGHHRPDPVYERNRCGIT